MLIAVASASRDSEPPPVVILSRLYAVESCVLPEGKGERGLPARCVRHPAGCFFAREAITIW